MDPKYLFYLLFACSLIACDRLKTEQTAENATVTDTTAFHQSIKLPDEQVTLLPEAGEITSNWLAYITAQDEIKNFDKYSVREIIQNATAIAEIMANLEKTVPAAVKTPAVEARLSVLHTKAKVLEQQALLQNPDPQKIALLANQIPREFNHLKIQLNEVFLAGTEVFDLEQEDKAAETSRIDTLLRVPQNIQ